MRALVVAVLGSVSCGRIGFQPTTTIDSTTMGDGTAGDGTSNAIAFVQEKSPGDGQNSIISIQLAQTAGDLLVMGGYWNASGNTMTVTDDTGLTWQALPQQSVAGCSANGDSEAGIWYAFAAATQTNTVNLIQTPGTQPFGFFVVEYAGVDPAAPLEAHAGANAPMASDAMSAGTLTLARSGVVVGVFSDVNGMGMMIAGAGFTALDGDTHFNSFIEQAMVGPGSYDVTAALPGGMSDACWVATAAAFAAR